MTSHKFLCFAVCLFSAIESSANEKPEPSSLQLLHEINRLRSNQCGQYTRSSSPKSLEWSTQLAGLAGSHSHYLHHVQTLSHRSSSGATLGERASNAGYEWLAIAENLAQTNSDIPNLAKLWMNSKQHRTNLCSAKYTEFGAHQDDGYWVAIFARPAN